MERKLATVQGSVEFRDTVMTADRDGLEVHARLHGTEAPTYRILPRHVDPFQKITLLDMFERIWPPVYMEDFAQALVSAGVDAPKVDIFIMTGGPDRVPR